MFIADMLSRASLPDHNCKVQQDFENFQLQQEDHLFRDIEQIHQTQHMHMQQSTQTQIKLATIKDPTMQTLANVVQKGWPD